METEAFNNSLGLFVFDAINVEDLPLLVLSSMFLPSINFLVFNISSALNIKNLIVVDICDENS
jgi:hypothetical protein